MVEEADGYYTLSSNNCIINDVDNDAFNEAILRGKAHVSVAMDDKTHENVIRLFTFTFQHWLLLLTEY